VINCTGLSAGKLGGVEDKDMVPARGQTVLVRNEGDGVMYATSGTDDGDDEVCYTMQRPAGESSTSLPVDNDWLTKDARWGHTPGGLLSERQLGFPARSQPSRPHYEESRRDLSFTDRRQRY